VGGWSLFSKCLYCDKPIDSWSGHFHIGEPGALQIGLGYCIVHHVQNRTPNGFEDCLGCVGVWGKGQQDMLYHREIIIYKDSSIEYPYCFNCSDFKCIECNPLPYFKSLGFSVRVMRSYTMEGYPKLPRKIKISLKIP
jgi:hypothetical protein